MKYPVQYDHGESAYGKKSSVLTDQVSSASWRASRYIDGVEYMILTDPFYEETSTGTQRGTGMRLTCRTYFMSLSMFLNHIGAFM